MTELTTSEHQKLENVKSLLNDVFESITDRDENSQFPQNELFNKIQELDILLEKIIVSDDSITEPKACPKCKSEDISNAFLMIKDPNDDRPCLTNSIIETVICNSCDNKWTSIYSFVNWKQLGN